MALRLRTSRSCKRSLSGCRRVELSAYPGVFRRGGEAASEQDGQGLDRVNERLVQAHPTLDAELIQRSVRTAYDEFRYARVRAYLPVLMERRARDLLAPDGKR